MVKQLIKVKTIDRVSRCNEWTKAVIPKIIIERTGKEATLEFIDGATRTFSMWWLSSLEDVRKRGR